MKKILFIILMISCATGMHALELNKTFSTPNDARQLSKRICELFVHDSVVSAVKAMRPYWPLPEDEVDDFQEKTVKYMNVLDDRFGKRLEYVKISEETIQDFAIKEVYIVRFEDSAIKLIFKYYKTPKGWILNSFKWDDSFDTEFK